MSSKPQPGTTSPSASTSAPTTPLPEDRVGRNIGVGCFTFFIGAVSGAMVGVGIGKLMGFFSRCTALPGLPACEWWVYAGYGGAIGAISLPVLALWRLRRADRVADAALQPSSD